LSGESLQAQPGPGGGNPGGAGNAQGAVRNVRDKLVALRDGAQTPGEAGLLDQAIKRLGRGLATAHWGEGGHLQTKIGQEGLGEIANATGRMMTLMAQADTLPSGQEMPAQVDNLWRACTDLAGAAMRDAVDAGGDPIAINDAAALFQQATD